MRAVPKGYNTHHVWFNRTSYERGMERVLRQHKGFVLPMPVEIHNELHANVMPPHKPNNTQIHGILQVIECSITPIYDTIDFLEECAMTTTRLSDHAQEIADNLREQGEYIFNGQLS